MLLYNKIAVGSRSRLRVLVRGLVVAIHIDGRYLLGQEQFASIFVLSVHGIILVLLLSHQRIHVGRWLRGHGRARHHLVLEVVLAGWWHFIS